MTRAFSYLFVVLCGTTLAQLGRGVEPWNTPFAKDTAHILAAARATPVPEGADAIVLLDEQKYSIDSAGRMTTTLRKVYRVLTADGVEDWASIEQRYAPWHERRPELRARVLTGDGATHWLDNKTITDAPAVEFDASIFSDSRVLRAPLPAVAADSVVEYEIALHETAPLLKSGSAQRINFWNFISTRRMHLVVDAAPGIPLHTASQLIPNEAIRRTDSKAGVHVECDWGPIERKKEWEVSTPFDVAGNPVFEFSTAPSWQEVAAQYGAIVDSRIGSDSVGNLGDLNKPGESPKAIAGRLVAAMHKQVRYTGLELGDAAIIPITPVEVLARRYGDCKDKATLLVAALRQAGLKANVALLLTGTGLDVSPELPGFGLFNHAIVRVEGPEPLWIDATAQYTRVGDLPAPDQGRLALIASAGTTALVKTPESRAADNRSLHTIEIRLSDYGPSEIRKSVETFGTFETALRSAFGGADPAKVKETLERQVKQTYLAEALAEFQSMRGDDFSQAFRLSVTARNAGRGVTDEDQAVAGLFTRLLFTELPFGLTLSRESGDKAKDEKPRSHDFVLPEAYQQEYQYRVFYPGFLKPRPLPKDEAVKMGPATFKRSYRLDPSGYVEAVYQFDTAKRRYTPAEYTDFRAALQRVWSEKPEAIAFSSVTSEALALGKTREAVRIARDYAEKKPESAAAQARLSRVLISAGAGDSAVGAAKKAVTLDPNSTQAWQALAWAYQHDSFGRRFRGNWNASEAEKAYHKAIEAAPDNVVPQMDLAILYEHNADGDRYGKGAKLDRAIEMYRSALTKAPNAVIQQNLMIVLMYAGKYDEAEKELKALPATGLNTVLAALAHSVDQAVLDAQNLFPDPVARASAFLNAAIALGQMRRHGLAAELLKAAKRINSSPELDTRLAAVTRIKRFDQLHFTADDPRFVVEQLYLQIFAGHLDTDHLRSIMTKREKFTEEPVATKKLRRMLAGLRGRFRSLGISSEGVLDMLSVLDLEKQGDDELGYRVYGKAGASTIPTAYVTKEDGQYRLLGTSDSPENVGKVVLDLLQANKLDSAQRWLDLVIKGIYVHPGQTPDKSTMTVSVNDFSSGSRGDETPAARFLWADLVGQGRTAEATRIAAASLIGTFSASDEAIAILKQARLTATNRTDRGNIDLALCQAYAKARKWTDLLATAKRLTDSYAVADKSFAYVAQARMGLKQWAELEQDARAELKTAPENAGALRTAALAMMRAGKTESATEYIDRLRTLQFAGKEEHNLEAWHAILLGKSDDKLVEELERDKGPADTDPAVEYSLGLLKVLSGKAEEAQRSLSAALELDDWTLLDARVWVLQGRIQEQYGNVDAAKAAYAEARKQPTEEDESQWALKLIPGGPKE